MKVAIFAGVLLAFCNLSAQAQNPPSPNADNGKKLYNTIGCWMCHGYSAQGGTGSRLAPDPLPLDAFVKYIRTPKGQMPPYTAKVLKDSELADILAFLKTLPKPPEPASIPLLKGSN
jgi:ubiquinol-cytochrome c reductase cytochrome c subunit